MDAIMMDKNQTTRRCISYVAWDKWREGWMLL
jgi:hypothetical protein